ncbi:hypothetical protein SUGI_0917950 [Cryptomeria japonica]|nr:hypothetical protein SUGI_0917950 [Cryptomeria japonica]
MITESNPPSQGDWYSTALASSLSENLNRTDDKNMILMADACKQVQKWNNQALSKGFRKHLLSHQGNETNKELLLIESNQINKNRKENSIVRNTVYFRGLRG